MTASPSEQFGPYRVYEQLGVGGMASVHRAELAETLGFQQVIALKRMLPHVAADDNMVAAFVREARLASHLRHANVAQTFELGRVDNIYFIAMELVTGHNLREVLKHCAIANTGPMPVPVALHILNQICDALDYAHNLTDATGTPLGIIHRDVTPSNIIVSDSGIVKLIDFGIAKASAAGMQTMSGTLKGKFGYMAPEYIAGSLDARADLFALGVIAHELLTNRPLFTGRDDLETLTRVQQMDIHPPSWRNPSVPREVDDLVMTALARNPDQRWQHATALRTVLGTITQRLGLVATNQQVTAWIDFAYAQPDLRTPRAPAPVGPTDDLDDEPLISMSSTTTEGVRSPPSRPTPPAVYGRHQGIAPGQAVMASAVLAHVRPSEPRIVAVPMPLGMPHASPPATAEQAQAQATMMRPSQQIPATIRPSQQIVATSPHHQTLFSASGMIPIHAATVGVPPAISPAPTPVPASVAPSVPRKGGGWLFPILMILVVAVIAGAVVYFVLPRLT